MLGLLLALRVLLGDPFPEATLPALAGEAVTLPPRGHVAVIEVFATWCASCHQALPLVERLRARFGDDLVVVEVSEDEGDGARAALQRLAAELGLAGPIVLDGDHQLYERLGVRKLPTAYLVDASGIVRHIDNGFGRGYEARLAGWIRQMLRAARPGAAP